MYGPEDERPVSQRTEAPPSSAVLVPLAIASIIIAMSAMTFVQVNMRHQQERTDRMVGELNDKQTARIETLEQRARDAENGLAFNRKETAEKVEAQQKTIRVLSLKLKKLEARPTLSTKALAEAVARGDFDWAGLPGRR